MDRLLVLCALLTFFGLVTLGAVAEFHEPRPVPFERLPRFEGQRVCVEAVLAHVRPTESGARLVFEQGDRSLGAFARFDPVRQSGDLVVACGRLEASAGTLHLRLDRPADLSLRAPFDAEATPLVSLAARPWDYIDRHVVLYADVEREGGRAWAVDPTTQVRLPLSLPPLTMAAGRMRIEGVLSFDPDEAAFRLHVTEVAHV